MPANGRWDLIRRLKVICIKHQEVCFLFHEKGRVIFKL